MTVSLIHNWQANRIQYYNTYHHTIWMTHSITHSINMTGGKHETVVILQHSHNSMIIRTGNIWLWYTHHVLILTGSIFIKSINFSGRVTRQWFIFVLCLYIVIIAIWYYIFISFSDAMIWSFYLMVSHSENYITIW